MPYNLNRVQYNQITEPSGIAWDSLGTMMNLAGTFPFNKSVRRSASRPFIGFSRSAWLSLGILVCAFPLVGHAQTTASVPAIEDSADAVPINATPSSAPQTNQQLTGSIRGLIVDPTGTAVPGADVKLSGSDKSFNREVQSGSDGQFSVADFPPGHFQLMVTSDGFDPQTSTGTVNPGETYIVPKIVLNVASLKTEVRVELAPFEVAEEQIKDEEKQRVFGVLPNFYVSYVPDAAPLSSTQKFKLALKASVDPVTFALSAAIAGIEQSQNYPSGFGPGAQGYAKRFGANYADYAIDTFIGGAILPSMLKQDPRYFYKGKGGAGARLMYALANAVICKGDNGHWQANYSNMLGGFASGAISNLYYPRENHEAGTLTIENGLIDIGASAAYNVIEEFVLGKFTSNRPDRQPAKP